MARVKLLTEKGEVAPEHYALFDDLAALRGRVSGPSAVVLHSPALARPWNDVGEYLHRASIVDPRHYELAVCVTAREQDCAYVWAAHLPLARSAGVAEETLAAVRDQVEPDGLATDEEAHVVRYVRALLRQHRPDGDALEALVPAHGERWLVELTAWAGRYEALACVLNAFEVLPDANVESFCQ